MNFGDYMSRIYGYTVIIIPKKKGAKTCSLFINSSILLARICNRSVGNAELMNTFKGCIMSE